LIWGGDATVLAGGKGKRWRAALTRVPCRPLRAMAVWKASGRGASRLKSTPAGGVDHRAKERGRVLAAAEQVSFSAEA
jgi:hypothetical protein